MVCMAALSAAAADTVNLAGTWNCALDPQDAGIKEAWFTQELSKKMELPGSLQEQGFGDAPSSKAPWTG